MRYVAFFRNVNLGQPKSPTKTQLESALVEAGASFASSFRTNGTAVIEADSGQVAGEIVARACQKLLLVCGLEQPAYVCSLEHLADLVAANPFADVDPDGVYQFSASFMPAEALASLELPLRSPHGDVEVLRVMSETALSVSRKLMSSPGDATPFLEKILRVPVTTRSWNTIVNLVKKYA